MVAVTFTAAAMTAWVAFLAWKTSKTAVEIAGRTEAVQADRVARENRLEFRNRIVAVAWEHRASHTNRVPSTQHVTAFADAFEIPGAHEIIRWMRAEWARELAKPSPSLDKLNERLITRIKPWLRGDGVFDISPSE
ncbi:hypothetical protein [uncultured Microbacterium sp.]|uniref:hypothetical protein n=1 Tax=uncultured Microbacterium sp. TaxID=191216 RepID=UPI0028ED114A|nr:hypothetical protein [uncultured Microbacterium sp.]